jgi:hypothetical protein
VYVSSPSVAFGHVAGRRFAGPADPDRRQLLRRKAAGDCSRYADADDFSVVAVRPHLVGPGDEQLIGRIVVCSAGSLAVIGLVRRSSTPRTSTTRRRDRRRRGPLASCAVAFVVSNGQLRLRRG